MEENKKPKDLLSEILKFAKQRMLVDTVCQKLKIDKDEVYGIVQKLVNQQGYNIQIEVSENKEILVLKKEVETGQTIRPQNVRKKEVKILLISSTLFGLKSQQEDLLATAIEFGEKNKVDFCIHAGNLFAGKPSSKTSRDFFLKGDDRRSKKNEERDKSSYEKQLEYLVTRYPNASFKTYFVSGPRDLTYKETDGRDIMKQFCEQANKLAKSKKFCYAGDNGAPFIINGVKIEVLHAKPGAEPYTKSYEVQGAGNKNQIRVDYVFEDFITAADPDIVILGGRHIPLQIPVHTPRKEGAKKVELIEVPSLAAEGPSEKAKNVLAGARTFGCGILTLSFFNDGSLKKTVYEWFPMNAYKKENSYLSSRDISFLKDEMFKLEEEIRTSKHNKESLDAKVKAINLFKEEICVLTELIPMPRRLGHLAAKLNFFKRKNGKDKALATIKRLIEKGYHVVEEKHENAFYWERTFKEKFTPIPIEIVDIVKMEHFSDLHIGNRGSRTHDEKGNSDNNLLKKVYEIAEKEKCEIIDVAGDIFDGTDAHPGQRNELSEDGADEQRKRGLEVWPVSDIPTVFISGSAGHEYKSYWQKVGYDIVAHFVEGLRMKAMKRGKDGEKLYFYDEKQKIVGTYQVRGLKVMLRHPTGGAPESRSYRPQKIVHGVFREIRKGDPSDVHVIAIGHLHLAMFMMYKGIAVYLVPCLEDISSYLEAKTLIPDLGCWVSEIGLDKKGNVVYVKNEYFAFEPVRGETIQIDIKKK